MARFDAVLGRYAILPLGCFMLAGCSACDPAPDAKPDTAGVTGIASPCVTTRDCAVGLNCQEGSCELSPCMSKTNGPEESTVTTFEVDDRGRVVGSRTVADGDVVSESTITHLDGTIREEERWVDGGSRSTVYALDDRGRIVREVRKLGDDTLSEYAYEYPDADCPGAQSGTVSFGGEIRGHVSTECSDGRIVLREIRADGGKANERTRYVYGDDGRLAELVMETSTGEPTRMQVRRDELGRIESVVSSQGEIETRTTYDYACVTMENGRISREPTRQLD